MADLPEQLQRGLADRYRLERELGRGGMATVYLACDLRHDRPVALKVLHPELAATLGPERFQREIRLAARLQHPHILPVHDSGETAGQLWYTMPYVDGESLRDRLRRERELPLDDALQITREVADALEYAHSQGIVHRDIKPENILLSGYPPRERGAAGGWHALVADFGVARAVQSAGGEQLTKTGMAVGTPTYMAPEQAMGDRSVDRRSDIYSLACVLYEMLAGEAPYTGPSAQAIIAKRLTDPIPSVRRLRETVPPAIDAALQRALAKAPADRFTTAAAFTKALSSTASGHTLPQLTGAGPRHFTRPALRASLLVGAVLLLAVGGMVIWHGDRAGEASGFTPTAVDVKRLAVLPFDNLGRSTDAYFADGIAGEIRSKLAVMPRLLVVAPTSSGQYRSSEKQPRQIAKELGVQYLLLGRVQWDRPPGAAQGRIRVSPELIEASTGATKWAQPFDATLTDVFQVQEEIAGRVAEALNVALREAEQRTIAARPTENLTAYDYYLRGNEYFRRAEASGWSLSPKEFESAAQMYARAVREDPRFALAHAKLARAHLALYWSFADQTPERLRKGKAAADEALRLDPELPEAHLALGLYYAKGTGDYRRALREFSRARARQPENADILSSIATTWQRLGRFDSAAAYWRRAVDLDPRSPRAAHEAAWTLLYTRAYPEAQRFLERAAVLAPDWIAPRITEGLLHLDWRGDTARTREILQQALLELGVAQAAQLPILPLVHLTSDPALAPALDRLRIEDFGGDTTFYYLWKAQWHHLRGRPTLERSYSDSARVRLEPLARAQPAEFQWRLHLARVYAGLGRKSDAIREGERAVALADSLSSGFDRADGRLQLALIYARFGEADAAVARLSELMQIPSQYSENFLRVYPGFAALRGHSGFERLVSGL